MDSSIYCITSFNENRFHGRVVDSSKLWRTDFFVIYPEISGKYNIGDIETHTDAEFFNQYFEHIKLHNGSSTLLYIDSMHFD
jgi:hypothetical protein